MGKKTKNENVYEAEQVNKHHRKKSKKLEKRQEKRKNKKKVKKERFEQNNLKKFIKSTFKSANKYINIDRIPEYYFDIEKYIRKLIEINENAVEEIPAMFIMMEDKKAEIDLSDLENKLVQKLLLKLCLKLKLNNTSGMKFKITKKDISKVKYTTDVTELAQDSIESVALFVKSYFEYVTNNKGKTLENINQNDITVEEDMKKKELQELEVNYQYEAVEETLGRNAELINKAADAIMREENPEVIADDDDELVGPSAKDFLKQTMDLIKDEKDLTELFHNKKPNKANWNELSYNKVLAEDKERMKKKQIEIQEYEATYRNTSLLEEHQNRKKNKNITQEEFMSRPFNRNSDYNAISSKKAIKIIKEQNGLDSRFVNGNI